MLAAIIKPQAHESFLVQQFFKNAAEVWASNPHLRSKLDLQMKSNKNLGEHRKNRNCLKNQKDVMRDKVSGAIAIPKASRGCAPALPNQIQVVFLGQAAGEQKFFDPAIFQKCWRGSGRVALIAARRQRNPRTMLLAHGGGGEKSESFSRRGEQDNVINLKRLLNGKQNVWKYQNGEEKSDSDGREKDV